MNRNCKSILNSVFVDLRGRVLLTVLVDSSGYMPMQTRYFGACRLACRALGIIRIMSKENQGVAWVR